MIRKGSKVIYIGDGEHTNIFGGKIEGVGVVTRNRGKSKHGHYCDVMWDDDYHCTEDATKLKILNGELK
jgi:hypothetical protein